MLIKYKNIFLLLLSCFFLSSSFSYAQEVNVSDAYIRETLPGNTISSAYMRISNNNAQAIKLVTITSKVSPRIEIHQHQMLDGMMKMRQLNKLVIPAHENVLLQPYGLHLMIFDLQQPLKDGQKVSLTLHFANYRDININVPVISIKKKRAQH